LYLTSLTDYLQGYLQEVECKVNCNFAGVNAIERGKGAFSSANTKIKLNFCIFMAVKSDF
jgi:hypothetical protein